MRTKTYPAVVILALLFAGCGLVPSLDISNWHGVSDSTGVALPRTLDSSATSRLQLLSDSLYLSVDCIGGSCTSTYTRSARLRLTVGDSVSFQNTCETGYFTPQALPTDLQLSQGIAMTFYSYGGCQSFFGSKRTVFGMAYGTRTPDAVKVVWDANQYFYVKR